MAKLSIFNLRGMSRKVVDNYMVENNYKIKGIDFTGNVKNQIVEYSYNSSILKLSIKCRFYDNSLIGIEYC